MKCTGSLIAELKKFVVNPYSDLYLVVLVQHWKNIQHEYLIQFALSNFRSKTNYCDFLEAKSCSVPAFGMYIVKCTLYDSSTKFLTNESIFVGNQFQEKNQEKVHGVQIFTFQIIGWLARKLVASAHARPIFTSAACRCPQARKHKYKVQNKHKYKIARVRLWPLDAHVSNIHTNKCANTKTNRNLIVKLEKCLHIVYLEPNLLHGEMWRQICHV